MKKDYYLEEIKLRTNIDKKVIDLVVNEYLEILKNTIIKDNKASITNFGTFKLRTTEPHTIFSPIDGSKIKTDGVHKIYFSLSRQFNLKIDQKVK